MKYIKLTQGKRAIVDDEDYPELSKYKWHCMVSAPGYPSAARAVYGGGKHKTIYMHRVVNKTPDGLLTDHINGNRLDNRRSNLRTATAAQNNSNSRPRKTRRMGLSGYKGFYWNKGNRRWQAQISKDNKLIYLGSFTSKRDAALAYDLAARRLYGEFAKTNFVAPLKDNPTTKEGTA